MHRKRVRYYKDYKDGNLKRDVTGFRGPVHKTCCCYINPRVVVVAGLGRRSVVVVWTLGAKVDMYGRRGLSKLIVLPGKV
jgi:hypothetical protein